MYYSLWFSQNSCLWIIQNKVTQIKLNAWVMKMYVFSQNLIILVELKLTWSFQIEAGCRGCRGLCCRSGVSQWFTTGVLDRWGEQTHAAERVWPEGEFKLEGQEGRTSPRLYSHLQTKCFTHTHTKYTNVIVLSFSLVTSCFILKGSLLMCIIFYFLSLTLSAFL